MAAGVERKRSVGQAAVESGAEAGGQAAVLATGPGSEKYQRILDAAVEVIAEHGYINSPVS